MRSQRFVLLLALSLALALPIIGCGGGGGDGGGGSAPSGPPAGPVAAVTWEPPRTYADNSALDPIRDLDYYEFYVRGDQNFTDDDAPVAQMSAVATVLSPDGLTLTPVLTTEFLLDNLRPFTQAGQVYYLSIRAVGADQMRSGFSTPVVWDLSDA